MPININLTISDASNSKKTIRTESENLISQVLPNYKNKTVTVSELKLLEGLASASGDKLTLEASDISPVNILKQRIKHGEAFFDDGITNLLQGGSWNGDIYVSIAKGVPMYEIKEMFNLPDGALSNYCKNAPGNKDLHETEAGQVWFSAEGFAKGNNMSLEEVRAMFAK